MAGPTTQQLSDRLDKHIELVRNLAGEVQVLKERLENARENLKLQNDITTKLADSLARTTTQQELLGARCAALEKAQDEGKKSFEKAIEEIKKSLEERDRKLWALWVAVIVAFLALVGNLVVALFRK